jgi:hypothetical protein
MRRPSNLIGKQSSLWYQATQNQLLRGQAMVTRIYPRPKWLNAHATAAWFRLQLSASPRIFNPPWCSNLARFRVSKVKPTMACIDCVSGRHGPHLLEDDRRSAEPLAVAARINDCGSGPSARDIRAKLLRLSRRQPHPLPGGGAMYRIGRNRSPEGWPDHERESYAVRHFGNPCCPSHRSDSSNPYTAPATALAACNDRRASLRRPLSVLSSSSPFMVAVHHVQILHQDLTVDTHFSVWLSKPAKSLAHLSIQQASEIQQTGSQNLP